MTGLGSFDCPDTDMYFTRNVISETLYALEDAFSKLECVGYLSKTM